MKKGGIREQYVRITAIVMAISIGMGLAAYLYIQNSWTKLAEEQELSLKKSEAMDYLSNSIHQVFFRARGYYAFQIESELTLAQRETANVHEAIENLRQMKLDKDEIELINEVEEFLVDYEAITFPYALSLVEKNDYEGLRQLSLDGSNAAVNRLISYSKQYEDDVHDDVRTVSEETMKQFNLFSLFILIFGAILLSILTIMVWRVVNHFILPIERMKSTADKYQAGLDVKFHTSDRHDEIGELSNSFAKLITTIESKTDTLAAQNEELLMQQDELFKNQTVMQNALSEARYTKIRLERYNGLNHKLSLTLDKQELVNIVLTYFDEVYSADIGLLWLADSGEYALKGLSNEIFNDFKENRFAYIKLRLAKEPYFILKRTATYEKGIADNEVYTYDYIAGVNNSDGELSTFIALSRIGRSFSKEDMHDIFGLLNRVGRASDRIKQYEAINHERTLNQHILDNVNEGIHFVSNTDGKNKFNHALFQLFGSTSTALQHNWKEHLLTIVEDQDSLASFIETSLASTTENGAETFYTLQGEQTRVMNVYSVPVLLEGQKAGTIFVHRDITKEYEIDRMKTELVSTVSHELRTPLSSVLGFAELLLTRELKPERQKRYIEMIQKEAKRLSSLVNDFLDLQRMEYGKQEYHLSNVQIIKIVTETVNNFKTDDKHPFKIINNVNNLTVKIDADRIQQVFTNLISNAIKFSPGGGIITITLSKTTASLLVSIEDHGIGIPHNELSKMFEKFHRFDSGDSRKIGGTGLGLAICKEIIQSHRGDIWIESEEQTGTTVFFTLPL